MSKVEIKMTHIGKTALELKEEIDLKDRTKMEAEIDTCKTVEDIKKLLRKYL